MKFMRKLHISLFFTVLATLFFWGIYIFQHQKPVVPQPSPVPKASPVVTPNATSAGILGIQTKNSDCVAQGVLPDPACTPGAVFSSATKDDVCVSGYSQTVRDVPEAVKQQVYAEYGILSHVRGEYEVDHFISLELGGSNETSNLWPEPAEPRPGFHEKDVVENYLHDEVCSGKITLQEAQREIRTDWLTIYKGILH